LNILNNIFGIYYDFLEKQGKYWIKKDSGFQADSFQEIGRDSCAWGKNFEKFEIIYQNFINSDSIA